MLQMAEYHESAQISRQRVNIMQACALAGVSRRTIYYWIQSGKVEWVRTAGGAIRIYTDTVFRKKGGRQT